MDKKSLQKHIQKDNKIKKDNKKLSLIKQNIFSGSCDTDLIKPSYHNTTMAWTDNLGMNLIKSAEFKIGDNVVSRQITKSCIVCMKNQMFNDILPFLDNDTDDKIWFCSYNCRDAYDTQLKTKLSNVVSPYVTNMIVDKCEYPILDDYRWSNIEN